MLRTFPKPTTGVVLSESTGGPFLQSAYTKRCLVVVAFYIFIISPCDFSVTFVEEIFILSEYVCLYLTL